MFRLYTPVFLLQIFCLYHIYTHSKDFKWYLLVIFLPFIGSLIYLYLHFYNQKNIDKVGETVQNIFSTDSRTDKLKKEVEFSGTVNNRLNLANEYLVKGNYSAAAEQYEICLTGAHQDDPNILMKLLQAKFHLQQYDEVIAIGESLQNDHSFKKSNDRVALALAYNYTNQNDKAIAEFQKMNAKYSNYFQRYKFAELLNDVGHIDESQDLILDLEDEISRMDRLEYRVNRDAIRLINNRDF